MKYVFSCSLLFFKFLVCSRKHTFNNLKLALTSKHAHALQWKKTKTSHAPLDPHMVHTLYFNMSNLWWFSIVFFSRFDGSFEFVDSAVGGFRFRNLALFDGIAHIWDYQISKKRYVINKWGYSYGMDYMFSRVHLLVPALWFTDQRFLFCVTGVDNWCDWKPSWSL